MESLSAQFTEQTEYSTSSMPLVRFIDRWIYVIMAVFFIAIVLTGFIPDSMEKVALVKAGHRAPFPLIMHIHAVLMGTFLLVLLAQTVLVATGRQRYHRILGLAGFALIPAIVIAGFILVPVNYHAIVNALKAAPPAAQPELRQTVGIFDDIMLEQIRIGALFALFAGISLAVRKSDPGLHKRLMFLAIAPALAASLDRMEWLPTTFPQSPIAVDLYVFLAVAPLFAWQLFRTGKIHKAYLIWLAGIVATGFVIYMLWNTPWWHATAPRLVGA